MTQRTVVLAAAVVVAGAVALLPLARTSPPDVVPVRVGALPAVANSQPAAPNADDVEFTESGLLAGVTLRGNAVAIPVLGITHLDLRDSFAQPRGNDRRHVGIDIGAPLRTPVAAAMDGWIYSISNGPTGGLGLHMVDRTGRWLLYYAHLDGYAAGLYAGQAVRRGELLGYVGATGNARGWPHLHFEVGRLLQPGELAARPVNPYDFLLGRISAP
jgi:peptidoglycan LD-endopeptidase LytH